MSSGSPVPSVPPAPDTLTGDDFPVLWPVGTRWADNDMFGHLNNAVYYQLFDTAINAWIKTTIGLDPLDHPYARHRRRIGLPLLLRTALPREPRGRHRRDPAGSQQRHLPAGRASARRSHRSITALGHWVHVYVDRINRKPVPIPDAIRSLLSTARVDH